MQTFIRVLRDFSIKNFAIVLLKSSSGYWLLLAISIWKNSRLKELRLFFTVMYDLMIQKINFGGISERFWETSFVFYYHDITSDPNGPNKRIHVSYSVHAQNTQPQNIPTRAPSKQIQSMHFYIAFCGYLTFHQILLGLKHSWELG